MMPIFDVDKYKHLVGRVMTLKPAGAFGGEKSTRDRHWRLPK
jgi:hypothetical protein